MTIDYWLQIKFSKLNTIGPTLVIVKESAYFLTMAIHVFASEIKSNISELEKEALKGSSSNTLMLLSPDYYGDWNSFDGELLSMWRDILLWQEIFRQAYQVKKNIKEI